MKIKECNPLVSIIVPAYNVGNYLRECLESAINQTLDNIEIICINDGSTDHSKKIIEEFIKQDDRIKIINQKNQGAGNARNNGLEKATGEFVYFLDGDDFLELDAVRLMYVEASQQKLDILFFDGSPFYENISLEKEHKIYKNYYSRDFQCDDIQDGITMYKLFFENESYLPSVCLQLFNRGFLKRIKVNFPENIIHEDNLFTFKCILQAKRVKYIKEKIFNRRIRNDSIMTNKESWANVYGYFISLIEMFNFSLNNHFDDEIIKVIIAHLKKIFHRLFKIFCNLEKSEKIALWNNYNYTERFLFTSIFSLIQCEDYTSKSSYKRKLMVSEGNEKIFARQLKSVQNSFSFKVGRMVTWIPRKLRNFVLIIIGKEK